MELASPSLAVPMSFFSTDMAAGKMNMAITTTSVDSPMTRHLPQTRTPTPTTPNQNNHRTACSPTLFRQSLVLRGVIPMKRNRFGSRMKQQ